MRLLAQEKMDDAMALRRWDVRAKCHGWECPTWMAKGRWTWTISCRAKFKRGQLPGSCTPLIPVAPNSKDNSETSPSDLFLQLPAKWKQQQETLIRRIHTNWSSSIKKAGHWTH